VVVEYLKAARSFAAITALGVAVAQLVVEPADFTRYDSLDAADDHFTARGIT
jgi:hypothetical protein